MDLGLRGRAAIVTGASGGIGGATARLVAAEGAALLLVGRRREALRKVARACTEAGAGAVSVLAVDLTGPEAAERVVDAATDGLGRLDVLVNAAGASGARPLQELSDADWQEQWELNVMAPMRLMRAAAPVMAAGGWGRIVNVSSSAGKRPSGSLDMPYSVAKAGMLSLSRAFADLYAGQGVLVNAVAPGPVDGELWLAPGGLADQLAARAGTGASPSPSRSQSQSQSQSREEVLAATAARVPLGRMGREQEVAAVIAFLCSEAAANVVGAAWSVDGGAVPGII
ncbi:MAG TPA: SDR family oxidoreductase [Solirubrobacteraceae bacterium]|jgi:NAD(P)-dependent dehydrogenase (short-subunit alcohol dehydrogenase family)|nr:SDR family oxidoreductase [Solirubrobacteraceae bacterium]